MIDMLKKIETKENLTVQKKKNLKERCQRCGKGSTVTDPETGELFCSKCGYVMSERIENSGPEWRSFADDSGSKGRTGDKVSLSRHDMGLSTKIDPSNKDATGKALSTPMKITIGRLRIWDSRSQSKPADRSAKIAFSELHKLKDKLSISDAVVEKTAYLYRKALEKKLVRGRSISAMLGAALYAACREADTTRTLKDFSEVMNIKKGDLAVCYRKLVNELGLKIPVVDSVQCVPRISSRIGMSEKTKRMGIEIIRKANSERVSEGKNPMSIAATALYLASVVNGETYSQKDIAQAANITEVTIRNRIRDLKKFSSVYK